MKFWLQASDLALILHGWTHAIGHQVKTWTRRWASGLKRGAQKGHPGSYRAALPESQVNAVHTCLPAMLCECGSAIEVRGKPSRHHLTQFKTRNPAVPPTNNDAERAINAIVRGDRGVNTYRIAVP